MSNQKLVEIRRDDSNYAIVNLHGATLTSWVQDGIEMIFVSKDAVYDNKKAIRGGIPVVFPCFGAWDLGPQHGFARSTAWELHSGPEKDPNGDCNAVFELLHNAHTRTMWKSNKFRLLYRVIVGGNELKTEIIVKNLNDSLPFSFTWLLHTYFQVPDVTKITISGLGGLTYVDKVDDMKEKQETDDPLKITGFTDRVYKGSPSEHVITNVAGGRTICLTKNGFPDTVVWNPWEEKAKAMSDFGDDEYPYMICVEAGYVSESRTVQPGETYEASQSIKIM